MNQTSQSVRSRHDIYCDILYRGLLQIRSQANDDVACFIHSDHIHNIPDLLKSINNEELHKFYWNCMRIDYDRAELKDWPRVFDDLWEELADATEREAGYRPK